jgi:hypothetical protein
VVTAPDAAPGQHVITASRQGAVRATATVTCVTPAGVALRFTGLEVRLWLVALALLLAAGTGALAAGRRRSRQAR